MTEMIEKVADGLIARFKETVSASAGMPFNDTKVAIPDRSIWLSYARAAIAAMREPTEPMKIVTSENTWHAVQDYQAMIDAALGE